MKHKEHRQQNRNQTFLLRHTHTHTHTHILLTLLDEHIRRTTDKTQDSLACSWAAGVESRGVGMGEHRCELQCGSPLLQSYMSWVLIK